MKALSIPSHRILGLALQWPAGNELCVLFVGSSPFYENNETTEYRNEPENDQYNINQQDNDHLMQNLKMI